VRAKLVLRFLEHLKQHGRTRTGAAPAERPATVWRDPKLEDMMKMERKRRMLIDLKFEERRERRLLLKEDEEENGELGGKKGFYTDPEGTHRRTLGATGRSSLMKKHIKLRSPRNSKPRL
jgi:hypothetical protein